MSAIPNREKWQEEALVLIGSTNYSYVESLRSFIENRKSVWSAWSFRIREKWRDIILSRLKTQGKFGIFFYLSKSMGGSGKVEFVGAIDDIRVSDTPIKTPNPDLTNVGEEVFPTDVFKSFTWFKFSKVDAFVPLDLSIFRNIDTEDPIVPSQLRASFAYAYLPEDFVEQMMEEKPADVTPVSVEKDLRKYLVANLNSLEPSLRLYQNEEKSGEEYQIEAGKMRIDILAVDKADKFVVIELKAGIADLSTFGQISGYMGWVKQNLTNKDVRGIIVANNFDEKMKYATSLVPNIKLKQYDLKFEFKDVSY